MPTSAKTPPAAKGRGGGRATGGAKRSAPSKDTDKDDTKGAGPSAAKQPKLDAPLEVRNY